MSDLVEESFRPPSIESALEVVMKSRPVGCALLAAFALACSNDDSTPTSVANRAAESPAMIDVRAQVQSIAVLTQESDYTRDGIVDQTSIVRTSYDRRGNAVLVEQETYGGGPTLRVVTRSTYDRFGNALEQVIDRDYPPNGPRDSRYWITTRETDRLGRPLRRVYATDDNLDGTPDHESTTLLYPSYDRMGQPLIEIEDADRDGDGTLETRTTQTKKYDRDGNVIGWTSESDEQMDGSVEEWFRIESKYNNFGMVVEEASEWDFYNEGVSRGSLTTSQNDRRGNPITQLSSSDYAPVDGVADTRTAITSSFDDRHRPLTQVWDQDRDADGDFDSRVTRTFQYFGVSTTLPGPRIPTMSWDRQPGTFELDGGGTRGVTK
jgi:hypothetical protein